MSGSESWVLFSNKEREEIREAFDKIAKGDRKCMNYSKKELMKAVSGMYLNSEEPNEKKKKYLCSVIEDANKEKADPVVHENSITAWGNQAAEKYGLEIGDITKMEFGEEIDVLLLDRNVGDYMDGTKKGTSYDPKKQGLSPATYIHGEGLNGILKMHVAAVVFDSFQWEINLKTIGGPFWGPIDCDKDDVDWRKLDPRTKVGWRGPAIKLSDANKFLPKKVTHYGTWWDDYMPFRYDNFLEVERSKRQ